jgi:hypothetical protein
VVQEESKKTGRNSLGRICRPSGCRGSSASCENPSPMRFHGLRLLLESCIILLTPMSQVADGPLSRSYTACFSSSNADYLQESGRYLCDPERRASYFCTIWLNVLGAQQILRHQMRPQIPYSNDSKSNVTYQRSRPFLVLLRHVYLAIDKLSPLIQLFSQPAPV